MLYDNYLFIIPSGHFHKSKQNIEQTHIGNVGLRLTVNSQKAILWANENSPDTEHFWRWRLPVASLKKTAFQQHSLQYTPPPCHTISTYLINFFSFIWFILESDHHQTHILIIILMERIIENRDFPILLRPLMEKLQEPLTLYFKHITVNEFFFIH